MNDGSFSQEGYFTGDQYCVDVDLMGIVVTVCRSVDRTSTSATDDVRDDVVEEVPRYTEELPTGPVVIAPVVTASAAKGTRLPERGDCWQSLSTGVVVEVMVVHEGVVQWAGPGSFGETGLDAFLTGFSWLQPAEVVL